MKLIIPTHVVNHITSSFAQVATAYVTAVSQHTKLSALLQKKKEDNKKKLEEQAKEFGHELPKEDDTKPSFDFSKLHISRIFPNMDTKLLKIVTTETEVSLDLNDEFIKDYTTAICDFAKRIANPSVETYYQTTVSDQEIEKVVEQYKEPIEEDTKEPTKVDSEVNTEVDTNVKESDEVIFFENATWKLISNPFSKPEEYFIDAENSLTVPSTTAINKINGKEFYVSSTSFRNILAKKEVKNLPKSLTEMLVDYFKVEHNHLI